MQYKVLYFTEKLDREGSIFHPCDKMLPGTNPKYSKNGWNFTNIRGIDLIYIIYGLISPISFSLFAQNIRSRALKKI